jgi:hypothetical protein
MTRTITGLLFAVIVITFSYKKVYAATYSAATCNESDVQAAIAKATHDGDVVSIPEGTCTWTTTLNSTFSNSVTIQGAGAESATAGGSSTTGTDQTILYDGINRSSQDVAMWNITTIAGKSFRITGIALYYNNGGSNISTNGSWRFGGYSQALRIDHCHFHGTQNHWLEISDWQYGVADHNVFDLNLADANGFWFRNGGHWNNDSAGNGDQSWADQAYWGSNKFFFVEDTQFNGNVSPYWEAIDDCNSGGRFVIRYSTFTGDATQQTHPTLGDVRGCRAIELYKNVATYTAAQDWTTMFSTRAGTVMIWGNTATVKNLVDLNVDRINTLNGTYPGWGLCGNGNPGQGYSGTVNTSGTSVTYVSGTHFDMNWPGDALVAMYIAGTPFAVQSCSTGTSCTLKTSAGTQTGVAYYAPSKWDGNNDLYGYACIDQPGRGKGDLLTGLFPNKVDNATGTITWPNQALEPNYIWANSYTPTRDDQAACVASASPTIINNRDYYQQFSSKCELGSFDGTHGVGQGSLPPTNSSAYPNAPNCTAGPGGNTPGVGYWDTSQNTLYVCTATNTWTAYYAPYTYPHPLTVGSLPDPPTNLVATPH